jgi:hypothetical protein
VRDARGVHDADEVKLEIARLEIVQQADAAPEHDGHQVDGDLIEQTLTGSGTVSC